MAQEMRQFARRKLGVYKKNPKTNLMKCWVKVRYTSWEAAEAYIDPEKVKVYKCPLCMGFHRTSKRKGKR